MKATIIKIVIYIISFTFFIAACSRRTEHLTIPTLPVSFEEYDFSLDDIAHDIVFIPLKSDIILSRIDEIKWADSVFYIKSQGSKIFTFTNKGDFIDVLSRNGRGPDEYLGINSYHVDDRNGNIYINTSGKQRVMVYDKQFNHIRDIILPTKGASTEMYWLNDTIFFFPKGVSITLDYDWFAIDTSGTILDYKINLSPDEITSYSTNNSIIIFEGNGMLYRYYNLEDTIFGISNKGFQPLFVIKRDFDDGFRMETKAELTKEIKSVEDLKTISPVDNIRSIYSMLDIGSYWLIAYIKKESGRISYETTLFDLNANKSYILQTEEGLPNIPNDWIGSGSIYFKDVLTINDKRYLVSYMDSYELISIVKSDTFRKGVPKRPELKQQMLNIADTLTIDDNPVLLLLELK